MSLGYVCVSACYAMSCFECVYGMYVCMLIYVCMYCMYVWYLCMHVCVCAMYGLDAGIYYQCKCFCNVKYVRLYVCYVYVFMYVCYLRMYVIMYVGYARVYACIYVKLCRLFMYVL